MSLGAAGDKNHIVNFLDHKCSFKDCRWQCFVNFFKKTNRTRVRCLFVHIFGPDSEVQKRRADILGAQAHIFRFPISAVAGGAGHRRRSAPLRTRARGGGKGPVACSGLARGAGPGHRPCQCNGVTRCCRDPRDQGRAGGGRPRRRPTRSLRAACARPGPGCQ